ncbi:hypothetical protein REC12_07885 [Desulfosporosinus sp. PR]|uniref:hypothetical protein n=1 Tax=Candidatus Desulfosporosinus nitrosoreducens TaxID=3401928 RepID=UPI0027F571AF|nr:hypothetical protein [Desulfosporosinus sp. PR]MDQ7093506.1 hypothetical protein [Desulfosporosinus sp. PR]
MEFNKAKVRRMYWQDIGLVLLFLVFSWLVLGYVLVNVSSLAATFQIREVALAAGLLAVVFVSSSLIAVLAHLKKNREAVYNGELCHAGSHHEQG